MQADHLSAALASHQAGDWVRAEKQYRQILADEPNHADALHLLGMVHHQTGRSEDAERLIRRAIAIQPKQAVYQSNLGLVLAARGNADGAIEAYRTATQLDPSSPEALNNLAVALCGAQRIPEAVEYLKRAILLRPDYADARVNLLQVTGLPPDTAEAHHAMGEIFSHAGQSAEAIRWYRLAIAVDPQSAESHNNLGNVLFTTGDRAAAIDCYQRAIEINQLFPQARNNLANLLAEINRVEEAVAAYQKAAELQPDSPEPLSNLGNLLRDGGHWDVAMEYYQKALAIRPDHAITHNNIGNAHCERGDWPAAILSYDRAIAIKSDYADATNNLGTAMEEMGRRGRAMELYQSARLLDPDAVSPPWNIALLQLLYGDYENGWAGYEHRWNQKKQRSAKREFAQPMVCDSDLLRSGRPEGARSDRSKTVPLRGDRYAKELAALKNKRVLLHAEQGYGDAIQFCRYATLVYEQGAEVVLECPPPLVRLLASVPGVTEVIATGDPLPAFDLHCPLMSLPRLFGTTLENVPATMPYLAPDIADLINWSNRFDDEPPAYRIGLVWAGCSAHQKDRQRSLDLARFARLSTIPKVRLYSLQVGAGSAQTQSPPRGMQIVDWSAELRDFSDTAGLISQLDLVITVDTAVAHLAGAMGKAVWVLLAYQPDWRWLLDREDSPWYPSARLFRQAERNDWAAPLEKMIALFQSM